MRGWVELIIVLLVPFVSGGLVILSCFAVDVGCAVVVWSSQKKLDESFPPIFFSRSCQSFYSRYERTRRLSSFQTMEDLLTLLPLDNQFFSGGLGLAAMGVGLSFLRKSSATLQMLARRHLMMTLEVTSKDVTYPWVLNWLNAHGRRTQHLSVATSMERALDGSSKMSFDLVPGPGRHIVTYNGRYFMVVS